MAKRRERRSKKKTPSAEIHQFPKIARVGSVAAMLEVLQDTMEAVQRGEIVGYAMVMLDANGDTRTTYLTDETKVVDVSDEKRVLGELQVMCHKIAADVNRRESRSGVYEEIDL